MAQQQTEPDAPEPPAREHFIPLRKADLVNLLCREPGLSAAEQDGFRRLATLLTASFHVEYHDRLEELKDEYAPFNPDADTKALDPLPAAERHAAANRMMDRFGELMGRANFMRLDNQSLVEASDKASDWGVNLKINLDVFDRLELHFRGDGIGERYRRRWQRLWRVEAVKVPLYQRLVVIFRLKEGKQPAPNVDTHPVYIKYFKDIPTADIEMLLPGTSFKMSKWEKGQIALPTLSGVAMTVFKLVTAALVMPIWSLLALIGGTIGYGVKSYQGYLNTRQKYQLTLTQSLYYQSLDSNAGVLFRLLDEAEEQEAREALLAYWFLWRHAGPEGWDEPTLDAAAEAFLLRTAGLEVDFEVDDAMAKLVRLRLVEDRGDGRLAAVPLPEALRRLDEAWDNVFTYDNGARA